ncbi:MAG: YggS family pyridoxal phosphate-dependent enzyme, partial [Lachnospiraceae bacterium]|nr:YggS family pyridoxal phosphate-dependent enzyme [Lachnospiraceae bacterium]
YIVDKVCFIHSVDSLKLAQEISVQAVKKQVNVSILIEVNIAQEETKFGVKPADAEELIREAALLPGISIKGLMTIAPYVEDADENRQYFKQLKQLAVDISNKNIDNVSMNVLSMGMTGDYMTAIEEGASCVRVGTGIFGERQYLVK